MPDTAHLRRDYGAAQLDDALDGGTWWELFDSWFAAAAGLDQPHAVVLATADAQGRPRARNVLIKSWDQEGFVWATNYDSLKGHELAVNPYAGLCFTWIPLERQVVVQGAVSRVPGDESDAIFAARPRGAQLAAWASPQSQPLPGGRAELVERFARVQERFGDGPVPRPASWGGYRLVPDRVEFWQGRPNRLHDRICFRRDANGSDRPSWVVERLAP